MTGIERLGSARPVAVRAWGGTRANSPFSVSEDSIRPNTVTSPIALGGPIDLPDSTVSDDAPARQEAGAFLSELAALQRAMLGGGDPLPVLQRLDGMLDGAARGGSPALLALMSAVRLRAKVELARRGWGQNR